MAYSTKSKIVLASAVALQLVAARGVIAQVVYSEDFNRADTTQGTITDNVAPYNSVYTINKVDTGVTGSNAFAGNARIFNTLTPSTGLLEFNNNGVSSGVNSTRDGAVWTTTPINFSGFNAAIAGNVGKVVNWEFNAYHNRTASTGLSGLTGNSYGIAYVLGSTSQNFQTAGAGYAVFAGQSGANDPWTLVSFTNGLSGTLTTIATNGQTTSGTPNYYSVKVQFDTTTSQWTLFSKNNGTSAFSDARTDTYTAGTMAADSSVSYTGTNLLYTGAYYKASTGAGNIARFDNLQIELTAPATAGTPRNLVWNGTGDWNAVNAWKAPGNTTWISATPDNATFTNSGSTSVVVNTATAAGSLTFNSAGYNISGVGGLTLAGASGVGVVANEGATISTNLTLQGTQSWTVAATKTFVVSGSISGSGALTISGGGRVELQGRSTNSGTMDINNATVAVYNAATDNGFGGQGTGAIRVNSGGVFEVHGYIGQAQTLGTDAPVNLNVFDGGTVVGKGVSRIGGAGGTVLNFPIVGTGTLSAPAVGDQLILGNSARNTGSGGNTTSTGVINVTGAGVVRLASGGTSRGATGTQFSGSWTVNMDNATGVLALGPVENGGFGEILNALGYLRPIPAGTGAYSGETRPVTINSGTVAIGADGPNTRASAFPAGVSTFRSAFTLAGGSLGVTGFKYNGIAADTDPAAGNVVGGLSGNLTVAAGNSSIKLYDVLGLTAGTGNPLYRDFNITTDAAVTEPGRIPAGNLTWVGNLTLDAGGVANAGGTLTIDRDLASTGGTVSVTAGAKILPTAGTTLKLAGPGNTLVSSGGVAVDVVNTGNVLVTAGTHTVHTITGGTGVTTVAPVSGGGATLTVQSAAAAASTVVVDQASLNLVSNSEVGKAKVVLATAETLDGSGKLGSSRAFAPTVSVLGDLNISTNAQVDVTTNDIIVRGTSSGDAAAKLTKLSGYAASGQNGTTLFAGDGLTSSVAAADADTGLRFAVGVVQNSFAGSAVYDTFDGQAVTQNDVLVKFTYFGDADLSGSVDDTDFFLANNGLLNGLTGWLNGDFDYSGLVDDTDFFLLNNGYLNQGGVLRAGSGVPEPTGMGLIALAAGGLLGRRRRA